MSRLRFIILCAIGGFVVFSGFLLLNARYLSGVKLGALRNMLPANVDMRLSNLVLNETGESGRTMSLNAATAHYFKEENYFLLNDITASVISEDTNLLVFADEGRYAPDQKAVVLTGHVRTEDQEGHVLTSSRLDLNMDSATLTSQGNFCLEDPALSLTGQSFVYNSKTGVLDVNGRLLFMISQL